MVSNLDSCIGYIIREPDFPNRKLGFLGDTCDASAIELLLRFPSPSLLVHEATDACIPASVDPQARRKGEEVQEKVLARGHSTPTMAGDFARRVGAERLVLNHIGNRFPAPRQLKNERDVRFAVIDEISRQASEAWGMGHAQVAHDFMRVNIPTPSVVEMQVEEGEVTMTTVVEGSSNVRNGGWGRERGSSDIGQQRGRSMRKRGWRMRVRGNSGGENDRDIMTARAG